MRPLVAVKWLVAGALLLSSTKASAFCRTTTCDHPKVPEGCRGLHNVQGCSNEGKPLYWGQPCLAFSVNRTGSKKLGITSDSLERLVRTAFDNWEQARCADGGLPGVKVETYPQVDCTETGYKSSGPNSNQWIFRDDAWPYEGTGDSALAMTRVTFDPNTGEIFDTDVELNSKNVQFTSDAAHPDMDLPSVLQHESGHVLGLSHSSVYQATMFPSYSRFNITMRTLEDDDIAAICAAFPSAGAQSNCNAEPRHGFSTACSEPGCCTLAPGRPRAAGSAGLSILVAGGLGLLLAGMRRRGARGRDS